MIILQSIRHIFPGTTLDIAMPIMTKIIAESTSQKDVPAEIQTLRAKLIEAEKAGFTDQSAEEILAEIKAELRQDGAL